MSMGGNASVIKNNACVEGISYVHYKVFSKQLRIIDSRIKEFSCSDYTFSTR